MDEGHRSAGTARRRRPSLASSVAGCGRRAGGLLAVLAVGAGLLGCAGGEATGGVGDPSASTGAADTTVVAGERASRTSTGCGREPTVGPTEEPIGDVPAQIGVDGQSRRYRLGLPDRYDPDEPVGVVLNLHGAGSNADQQSAYSQMAARGTGRGFVVVTPDAVEGRWELGAEGADGRFLSSLLDDVERRYCIDLDRVHAVGVSLGAWKATVTACAHPQRFASLVLVAQQVPVDDCAMPVLAFHGTADAVVPFGAGADEGVVVEGANSGLPGVEANLPGWAANGGCSLEKEVRRIEPDVEHWSYRGCPDGIDVELYAVEGGGHTWPGAPIDLPHLGPTTRTVDATGLALDWFEAHPNR